MTARSVVGGAALAAILIVAPVLAERPIPATPAQPAGRWRDASLDEYRKHLTALTTLVQSCAQARNAKTCDPALVGPDDRVRHQDIPSAERRLVRYGWLRVLFSEAQDKDEAPPKLASGAQGTPAGESAQPARRTTSELLKDAETRLAQDLSQADAAPVSLPAHAAEREAMKQVLAGRDFRGLEEPTARDSALEKLGNWLNRLFESAARLRSRSAWIGRLIVWGFILTVCVGLVWGLLQLERRWRIRPIPESDGPGAGAASARHWQLWFEDARNAAASGLWREAIHFLYWAAISRLESKRLWPADRARTPREYLALMALEDPRRAGLATLTGSFELTWYGGRPAAESDYLKAEQLAASLVSGIDSSGGGGR